MSGQGKGDFPLGTFLFYLFLAFLFVALAWLCGLFGV